MQATAQQPRRAPDGAPVHYERQRPEQTTLYRLVQRHAARFIAHTQASTGAELPRFVKDEFDAYLERGILAHGFLGPRCGECGHDNLLAFSCKRRGFCPSCGARRMSQTAAHVVRSLTLPKGTTFTCALKSQVIASASGYALIAHPCSNEWWPEPGCLHAYSSTRHRSTDHLHVHWLGFVHKRRPAHRVLRGEAVVLSPPQISKGSAS